MYRSRAAVHLALATLVLLSSTLLGAQTAAAADPPLESVLVTGTGEVAGTPDLLTANFAAEVTAATVGEALDRAGSATTKMRDTLVRGGLDSADLQTSNVDIGPQRDDKAKITGYTVNQGLTATIRDLAEAGALLTDVIAAGGDAARLNGVWFAIEDDAALLAAARKKAFADARTKAELYAREAGRPLGRVVRVSEVVPGSVAPIGLDYRSGAGAPMPVEPGQQRLTVTVTVEWALQSPA